MFYCRSYCLLNLFRAPLCPSSGAPEYYTGGCCRWYLVLWFSSCRYGVELRVMCPAPHHADNLKTKAPNTTGSNHLYNTLELLMTGIMVPETCWASNKICNKKHLLHLVGILFPHINENARSKSYQTQLYLQPSTTRQQQCVATEFVPIFVTIFRTHFASSKQWLANFYTKCVAYFTTSVMTGKTEN
jgi:hypothetical protein